MILAAEMPRRGSAALAQTCSTSASPMLIVILKAPHTKSVADKCWTSHLPKQGISAAWKPRGHFVAVDQTRNGCTVNRSASRACHSRLARKRVSDVGVSGLIRYGSERLHMRARLAGICGNRHHRWCDSQPHSEDEPDGKQPELHTSQP